MLLGHHTTLTPCAAFPPLASSTQINPGLVDCYRASIYPCGAFPPLVSSAEIGLCSVCCCSSICWQDRFCHQPHCVECSPCSLGPLWGKNIAKSGAKSAGLASALADESSTTPIRQYRLIRRICCVVPGRIGCGILRSVGDAFIFHPLLQMLLSTDCI